MSWMEKAEALDDCHAVRRPSASLCGLPALEGEMLRLTGCDPRAHLNPINRGHRDIVGRGLPLNILGDTFSRNAAPPPAA